MLETRSPLRTESGFADSKESQGMHSDFRLSVVFLYDLSIEIRCGFNTGELLMRLMWSMPSSLATWINSFVDRSRKFLICEFFDADELSVSGEINSFEFCLDCIFAYFVRDINNAVDAVNGCSCSGIEVE